MIRERGDDDGDGADRSLAEVGGLGHGGERIQPGPDLLVVAEDVVRDLEHGERGNAGGEPGEPHQRQADEEGEHAGDQTGREKRGDVSDCRVSQEVEEVRHEGRLLLLGDGEDARRPDPDRHEADVPEGEDAGVADEDVDRDDHGDGDERIDEVDLGGARDEHAEQRGADDQRDGGTELKRGAPCAHTRSTAARPRRKSPPGLTRRTRITRPKTNVGKYWLCAVGSAPPSRPET